jgi:rubredoxin
VERGDIHLSVARSAMEMFDLAKSFNGRTVTLCEKPFHRLAKPRLCPSCLAFLREYKEQWECPVCGAALPLEFHRC